MHKIIEYGLTTQGQSKRRPAFDRLSCLDPRNKWIQETDCLNRDVAEQKAHIEDLNTETEKRAQTTRRPSMTSKTETRPFQTIRINSRGAVMHWRLC